MVWFDHVCEVSMCK